MALISKLNEKNKEVMRAARTTATTSKLDEKNQEVGKRMGTKQHYLREDRTVASP